MSLNQIAKNENYFFFVNEYIRGCQFEDVLINLDILSVDQTRFYVSQIGRCSVYVSLTLSSDARVPARTWNRLPGPEARKHDLPGKRVPQDGRLRDLQVSEKRQGRAIPEDLHKRRDSPLLGSRNDLGEGLHLLGRLLVSGCVHLRAFAGYEIYSFREYITAICSVY